MTACYHHVLERVNQNPELDCWIPKDYSPHFEDMEKWYQGALIPSTFEHNAQMYPIMLKSKALRTPRQFCIYDISGEMFDGSTSSRQTAQEQMRFCNGIFFLIDPFSDGLIRQKREQKNADVSSFSNINPEYVAGNFINYLISIQAVKVSCKSKIPVSVLIVKADEPEIKPMLSPARIKADFKANPEKYQNLQEARDKICKAFLQSISLDGAVSQLESRFENLHYFPVSAIGHEADGTPFQPWGVDEALCWLTQLADKELAKALNINRI